MLKIRDDVELKQLEKFGFSLMECDGDIYYTKQFEFDNSFRIYWISTKTRIIEIEYSINNDFLLLDDTIYDLIQAGLVEKVEG